MSTTVISQEFASPSIARDSKSASGKTIAWPVKPLARVVNDEQSASGKSIVWSCIAAKIDSAIHSSAASTRANSPSGSSSTEELECYTASPSLESHTDQSNKISGKVSAFDANSGVRSAILNDLGVELKLENLQGTSSMAVGTPGTPSTSAGSPYMSSVGSPYTPASMCSSPVRLTGTRPPFARQDISNGSHGFFGFQDASQRTPPRCDASQRTPPQFLVQRSAVSRRPGCGDASQRSPAATPYAAACGSWGAATAAAAATRAAASMPSPPVNSAPASIAVNACPSATSHVASSPQVVVAAANNLVITTAEQDSSPNLVAESRMPESQVCSTDSVKCWLAGVSDRSMLSNEDLLERLRAALPDTYDD